MTVALNMQRAGWGLDAITNGDPDFDCNDPQTSLVDALANIMHLAAIDEDMDFARALSSAQRHFKAERGERVHNADPDQSGHVPCPHCGGSRVRCCEFGAAVPLDAVHGPFDRGCEGGERDEPIERTEP